MQGRHVPQSPLLYNTKMYLPFDSERYGELVAELNMLIPKNASEITAAASETAVLTVLEDYEIDQQVYWQRKLDILEKMLAALKNIPL